MDLNTITGVERPQMRAQLPVWTAGDAWLAGGTWLFSEPQLNLKRLIDLTDFRWPALEIDATKLTIAATCTVAQLDALACPSEWIAAPLINQCCRAFLASFKIWKTATVGGNLCMSLPAGPMISFTAALDGVCTIWKPTATNRTSTSPTSSPATSAMCSLRAICCDKSISRSAALKRRSAFRQISLTPVGPVGGAADRQHPRRRRPRADGDGVDGPADSVVLCRNPAAERLREAILDRIPDGLYHHDVHGKPAWRKHMTLRLAEEIRAELQAKPRS